MCPMGKRLNGKIVGQVTCLILLTFSLVLAGARTLTYLVPLAAPIKASGRDLPASLPPLKVEPAWSDSIPDDVASRPAAVPAQDELQNPMAPAPPAAGGAKVPTA